jgi:V/A-type H+/Na+-transporting ATPase subunit K
MNDPKTAFRRRAGSSVLILILLMLIIGLVSVTDLFAQSAETTTHVEMTPERAEVSKFGLIAAAIAFGFGAIGAGIAIAHVGSSAMAAIGEKPEIASQALIFIALAEGLVVFGFITALMILGKI